MDYRFQMQLFGRQNRKAMAQVKTHLMAEHGQSAGAGSVVALYAMVQHMLKQFKVLPHMPSVPFWTEDSQRALLPHC